MRRFVFILGLILITISLTQASIKSIEIALEAELAQKVEAPMKVDDNAVGKGASNGKFIWMEGKPVTGGGGEGWPSLRLTLPRKENTPFGGVS